MAFLDQEIVVIDSLSSKDSTGIFIPHRDENVI